MQGPFDFLRDRISNLRAHPFQSIASGVAGGFVPGGGLIANNLFGRYNNSRFNNSAQQFQDLTRDQSNLDTNAAMNKPLEGPLGDYDRNNPYGETGPDSGDQNRQLAQALSGQGGGMNGGGPSYQPYGGPSMSGQQWMDRSGGYGNIMGQMLGVAPDQSNLVNQLLDPISMGAGLPGSGVLGGAHGPGAVRDYRDGLSLNQNVGNYGISPMQVGGSNVIFGSGDPNGLFRHNQRTVGG